MIRKWKHIVIISLSLVLVVAFPKESASIELPNTSTVLSSDSSLFSGPHCGLQCVYVIAKTTGKDVALTELLGPEYITSREGSTLKELHAAATHCGLNAEIVANMTTRDLVSNPYPIILHVKSLPTNKSYDHYVLLVDINDRLATFYDPLGDIKTVPPAALMYVWDGTGLVMSPGRLSLTRIFYPAYIRLGLYALTVGLAIALIRHYLKAWRLPLLRVAHVHFPLPSICVIFATALFASTICHRFKAGGYFADKTGVKYIQESVRGSFIPKVDKSATSSLLHKNLVLVDSRYSRDYVRGHIESAISIPVNIEDSEWNKITVDVPKQSPIVCYCQSSSCDYAEEIAIRFIDEGFTNVAIYKGGWREYTN